MNETWKFVFGFLAIFVIGTFFDCASQLTYQRKSLTEITANLKRTMIRISILSLLVIVASVVWYQIGWL